MGAKEMKICLIGTVASSTLNFRKTFIELLIQEGHEVYVFATDYSEKTSAAIKALGAEPVSYQLNRGGLNPFADITSTIQLKNKIKTIAPDIVFSYFAKPVIFGTLAAKLAKVPRIVGMLEGLGYAFTPEPPHKKESFKKKLVRAVQIFLYKISFRYLDRIIFLNPDDPVDLLEKHKIKVKDVKILGGIGVDLEKFKPTPPSLDPIRFLFIGRLLAEKGIFEFLKAAEIVKQQHPEVEFIVLGAIDKDNPSSLSQNDLEYYKQANIITHPGHVDNVQAWIEKSSVFVLPSYREGVPCSTQEAMACGRTVITTDVPGCRQTVKDGVNGILIPSYSANELSEKIDFLINNPSMIIYFSEKSRIFAEEYFDAKTQNQKLFKFILKS
ncbi:glycosyltransferase family 4 protein [Comamonas aquatica]|uniref:glycosyltransferase family 4 protein n=1 Tax=Comamonas aquatica TaxID=225991 RepID=UPI0024469DAC|nr:glycosyltransferase family 4 protein [Comamonas aquatica]MDH1673207.1 glycosyltransferase family 4 protein [Comamonas aquatica]MDH1677730.1 glycosyltransferase family 4 protein [Comamonas aquatica]